MNALWKWNSGSLVTKCRCKVQIAYSDDNNNNKKKALLERPWCHRDLRFDYSALAEPCGPSILAHSASPFLYFGTATPPSIPAGLTPVNNITYLCLTFHFLTDVPFSNQLVLLTTPICNTTPHYTRSTPEQHETSLPQLSET